MSATNYLENALLLLLFNGDSITSIADDATTSPATNLYISLHTADPGEAGTQSTNEVNYTSYARVAVSRSSSGFTVASNVVSNTGVVTFPTSTGVEVTATHFGIGLASSSTGTLLFSGALFAPLTISTSFIPQFDTGDLTVTAD